MHLQTKALLLPLPGQEAGAPSLQGPGLLCMGLWGSWVDMCRTLDATGTALLSVQGDRVLSSCRPRFLLRTLHVISAGRGEWVCHGIPASGVGDRQQTMAGSQGAWDPGAESEREQQVALLQGGTLPIPVPSQARWPLAAQPPPGQTPGWPQAGVRKHRHAFSCQPLASLVHPRA